MGSPNGVLDNDLDYNVIASEFELQSSNTFNFRLIILVKIWNCLPTAAMEIY